MLIKCRECKTEVSSKARRCPSCGIKDPGVDMKAMKRVFSMMGIGLVLIFTISILTYEEVPVDQLYRGSVEFLEINPALGTVIGVNNVADWAQGKRQWVNTDRADFLFHLKGGEVVTVHQRGSSGIKHEIWRKSGS